MASALLGLWGAILVGPLGLGAKLAHHHEGHRHDPACLACTLLHAPITQTAPVAAVAAPALTGTAPVATTAPAPVASPRSPVVPRAPPPLAAS